jgi:hypothetical protein
MDARRLHERVTLTLPLPWTPAQAPPRFGRHRAARHQYAFAIGRSSAGKRVITLQPRSVTSSSMRAAE